MVLWPPPVGAAAGIGAANAYPLPNLGVQFPSAQLTQNPKVKDKDRIELHKYPVAGADYENWKDSTIDKVIAASAVPGYTRELFYGHSTTTACQRAPHARSVHRSSSCVGTPIRPWLPDRLRGG